MKTHLHFVDIVPYYFFSYGGDGKTCRDTNECAVGLARCSQDAECVNNIGSFTCRCKSGFTGNGEICTGKK